MISAEKLDAKRREAIRANGTNISWRMVAQKSGVSYHTIKNIRHGRSGGTTRTLVKLAQGFTELGAYCTVEDLVSTMPDLVKQK